MSSYYEKILATGEVKCIDEEVPFEIPVSWSWARLTHVTFLIEDCPHSTAKDEGKGYPLVRTPNIGFGFLLLNGVHRVSEKVYNQRNVRAVPQKNDLIFAREAPAGNIAVIQDEKVCLGQRTVLLRPITHCILPQYLAYYILAPSSQQSLVEKSSGTTVAHVNLSDFRPYLIAVPPIDEQKRIVNKLKELLPLLDKYNCYADKLSRLNNEINTLLKKSILQEAIQGRLVSQIAEEGTAKELLEQIKAEKLKLVKESKLKKSALNESVIFRGDDNKYYEQIGANCNDISDEIPFDLPYNWCWCRFSNIVSMTIGKTPARGEQTYWINGKYNWVSISDMVDGGTISTTKEKVSDLAVKEIFSAPISEKGSLLMSFKLSIGKTSILDIDAYHNEAIITIRPVIDKEYAMRNYLFKVLPLIANLGDSKDAIKGKTLNSKSLANLLIPLPPLQEQQRIIERINLLSKQLR